MQHQEHHSQVRLVLVVVVDGTTHAAAGGTGGPHQQDHLWRHSLWRWWHWCAYQCFWNLWWRWWWSWWTWSGHATSTSDLEVQVVKDQLEPGTGSMVTINKYTSGDSQFHGTILVCWWWRRWYQIQVMGDGTPVVSWWCWIPVLATSPYAGAGKVEGGMDHSMMPASHCCRKMDLKTLDQVEVVVDTL